MRLGSSLVVVCTASTFCYCSAVSLLVVSSFLYFICTAEPEMYIAEYRQIEIGK